MAAPRVITAPRTAAWVSGARELSVGYVIEDAWLGPVGDVPRVTGLIVKQPQTGERRLIYFDHRQKALTSIPFPVTK